VVVVVNLMKLTLIGIWSIIGVSFVVCELFVLAWPFSGIEGPIVVFNLWTLIVVPLSMLTNSWLGGRPQSMVSIANLIRFGGVWLVLIAGLAITTNRGLSSQPVFVAASRVWMIASFLFGIMLHVFMILEIKRT
jgi:hypothetical protein